jgi:exonuclease VII small subunit
MSKNENDGPQHMTDMLTSYKEAVQEFSSSAAEFLSHIPLLTKARDSYQRAMAVSRQLRQILDRGDETLRLLMAQMEKAANIQLTVTAPEPRQIEAVKVEATSTNGDKADAAHA